MFYDKAQITVTGGRGGDGCVSFRREAMVPRGGPDGGNGGRGGDVILRVSHHLNTLQHFQRQTLYVAEDGDAGRGKDMTGRSADALYVDVPPGTVVRETGTGAVLGDLTNPGDELIVAVGGRGGRGNATFKSSTNQAPEMATRGDSGATRDLELELKLIADIGIVGLPNAGKSTLLSVLTDARPKIANYPFTTLVPNLGVARIDDNRTVVLADIPGLIEGASDGRGLGHEFLRHIERTRVLIHLIDGMSEDPQGDYATIRAELAAFGHGLASRPEIIAMSKMDLPDARAAFDLFVREAGGSPLAEAVAFSSASGENARQLLNRAVQLLDSLPPPEEIAITPIIEMSEGEERAFEIERLGGGWVVHSHYLEHRADITRWDLREGAMRFQIALERSGVSDALTRAGIKPGDMVKIGEVELEWQDEAADNSPRRKSRTE